jgi:hypothetical protein
MIAPIEVLAAIAYANSLTSVQERRCRFAVRHWNCLRRDFVPAVLRVGRGTRNAQRADPDDNKGVPIVSILVALVVGLLTLGPFPSWNKLVNVVTGTTAIMYAFAPVSLAALRKRDPERLRPYIMPFPEILTPLAFCSASLLLYWGGFQTMWKIDCAILIGLMLFGIGFAVRAGSRGHRAGPRPAGAPIGVTWKYLVRPAVRWPGTRSWPA